MRLILALGPRDNQRYWCADLTAPPPDHFSFYRQQPEKVSLEQAVVISLFALEHFGYLSHAEAARTVNQPLLAGDTSVLDAFGPVTEMPMIDFNIKLYYLLRYKSHRAGVLSYAEARTDHTPGEELIFLDHSWSRAPGHM